MLFTDKSDGNKNNLNRHSNTVKAEESVSLPSECGVCGTKRPDLPTYRAEEVSKHDSK